jgi:2-phospho-L-lactate transferase/gluconeogenesis factor (CofD/UPF0052 family)
MSETSSAGLHVVAIGGGTGLSTLLRGLKQYVAAPHGTPQQKAFPCLIEDLSAIVTVTDDVKPGGGGL